VVDIEEGEAAAEGDILLDDQGADEIEFHAELFAGQRFVSDLPVNLFLQLVDRIDFGFS